MSTLSQHSLSPFQIFLNILSRFLLYNTDKAPLAYSNNTDESNNRQTVRDLVAKADTLVIQHDKVTWVQRRCPLMLASWTAMMGVVSSIIQDLNQKRVLPRLRSLKLSDGVLVDFKVQLSQLPHLITLTILQVDAFVNWDIMHLLTTFKACPNLEDLSVKPKSLNDVSYELFGYIYILNRTQEFSGLPTSQELS
ncbi:hypothetical protein BGX24_001347 [Mortierella sp. AD032]|nr:hypothetical protein BGX24_001347 [Mortierella sp. AD032]